MAFFPLSLRARRRILWVCGLAIFCMGTKLWLRFGPELMSRSYMPGPEFNQRSSTPPGLFRFHARAIVKSELGYPRRLEAYLAAPEQDTPGAAQLRAMDWWDGHGWTAKAKSFGEPEGRGLRIPAGEVVLDRVEEVTPSRDYNGPQMCQADYFVRWELPADRQSLIATRNLPGLRLPDRFDFHLPGERQAQQATLVRDGLGWTMQDAELNRRRLPGHPSKGLAWLAPLL